METIETLKKSGCRIIQGTDNFRFGIDAVLLAHFTKIRRGQSVCDLCTGTGIIPILFAANKKSQNIAGIEIDDTSFDMASRSVALNDFENKIKIVHGDLKQIKKHFKADSFNVVTVNPPYFKADSGKENIVASKNAARHEIFCNLEDVIKAARYLVVSGGSFFMIHKPERLSEIFLLLQKYQLEPKRLCMVQPDASKAPNLVLVEARRDAKSELKVEVPLVVYKEKGIYSDQVQAIYEELV